MDKKSQLYRNTAILGLGKFSTMLISLILLSLYTAYVSPSEFGFVDLIVTYIAILVPILTIQLDRSAFRYLIDARGDSKKQTEIISNVMYIVTFTVAAFTIVYFIAGQFIKIPYFTLVPLVVIASIYSNLFLQFARGFNKNKHYSIGNFLGALATLIFTIILVVIFRLGAVGMIIALIAANTVSALYIFFALRLNKFIRTNTRNKSLRREMFRYSLPLVPSVISWWIVNVSDRTIISIFLGVAANGIYAVANKYALIFMAIYSVVDMSWTESASMHINSKDRDVYFSDIYNMNFKIFGSLGVVMIATIPLVFNLMVGSQYTDAYNYIPILVVAAFFNAIVSMFSVVYIATKQTKKVLTTSIFAAIINISTNIILIKYIGIYAAAWSTLVAFLIMSIYRAKDILKYVNVKYEISIFVKLIGIYLFSMSLYYMNRPATNVVNALITIIVAVIINKEFISTIAGRYLNSKNKS